MTQETDKAFIRRFIAGNCTPLEQERMKVFMRQPGSEELFNEILNENWEGFKNENRTSDTYIQNFQQRLKDKLDSGKVQSRPLLKRLNFYRYAAVLTFLILGTTMYGLWQFNKKNIPALKITQLSTHNPYGQRSKVTLPDNSVVTLGPGSTLGYPEHFVGNAREISLEGEAFFEVTKNPEKPFIVHTGDVQTRVLGTSFKVNAFKDQPLSVVVATGKVRVYQKTVGVSKLKSLAVLLPGDQVYWNPVSAKASIAHIQTEEVTGWKNGKLAFVGVPLREMTAALERWYNVKIEIRNKKIREYRMSIVLDGTLPLTHSLEVIKVTVKADYKISSNTVIIK